MTQTNEPAAVPLSYAGHELNQIDRLDLAIVALRLMAIYLLIRGLEYIPLLSIFLMTGASPQAYEAVFLLMPGGIYIASGTLLMIFAPLGGRLLLPRARSTQNRPTGSDLQAIAFSVVGVVLVTRAVGGITLIYVGGQGARQIYGTEGWFAYLGPAIQLAIGIALFLGGRGLSRFWQKLRATSYGKENG
jgi:hypothetical protein